VAETFEPWVGLRPIKCTPEQMLLLGVTDQDLFYRDTLMQVTSHMIGSALRTPYGSGYYERMSRPYIGDLVMEYSRGWWSNDLRIRAWSFGVLVGKRVEWQKPEQGTRLPESCLAHYVRWGRGTDDIQRWENSQFMLVPVGRSDFGA
jgi:hypothetical protein